MAGICDVPVIDAICGVIGDTAAAVVSAPFMWLGQAAGAAAQWLFEAVWGLFETTTIVDITTTGYLSVYSGSPGSAAGRAPGSRLQPPNSRLAPPSSSAMPSGFRPATARG